jgi:outer membrane usher protein FimD/PapC
MFRAMPLFGRSRPMCLIALAKSYSAQWIVDADIKACFDRIDHEWSLRNIPMDRKIESIEAFISPWYRSGGVVEFRTQKFKAITGTLFFVAQGKKIPAEYAGLDVTVAGQTVTGVVGMGGVFYLENIPTGKHLARLYTQDKESTFKIDVPDSKETVMDLGEIDCEVK